MATKHEYSPEKRNFKDLWRMLFPVGIEWDVLDVVYQYEWNFSNLEEALEEGGELHNKKVYLFAFTEAECLPDKDKIILVPVVVAVVSPIPPFDKIGIVEELTEEIVPMEQMGFYWEPYIREAQVERLKHSQIFILSRHKTGVGLISYRVIDRMKMFGSCIPYLCNPFQEDELEQSTVELVLRSHPNRVVCEFYLEQDKIEDITDTLIQNEELPADQKSISRNMRRRKFLKLKNLAVRQGSLPKGHGTNWTNNQRLNLRICTWTSSIFPSFIGNKMR